jgi:hypothetical protein
MIIIHPNLTPLMPNTSKDSTNLNETSHEIPLNIKNYIDTAFDKYAQESFIFNKRLWQEIKSMSDRINNRFLFQDNTERDTRDALEVTNLLMKTLMPTPAMLSALNVKTIRNLLMTRLIMLLIIGSLDTQSY